MNRATLICSILLGAIALAACDQQAMLEKFASPAEQDTAKTFIDHLRHHDYDAIEKAADSSIAGPSLNATLNEMAALMPSSPPVSVTLVGAQRFTSTAEGSIVNLTFEYHFSDRYVIANLATKLKNEQLSIVGFHVYPESESLESQNRFKWSGKSVLQYAVLIYAICVALFTVVVLVVAAKTKMRRRKWLWILFVLFGVGKFSVNWTTGQWGVTLLVVQLFSASSYADFYGPWIISVSLPIGAIIFLLRRNTIRIRDEEKAVATPEAA